MEPLLELADRITAHIWYLHEVSPDEDNFQALSDQALSEAVKQALAADWARLEAVRDLADVICPDDPDPNNPLPYAPFESALQRPKGRFWDIFSARRFNDQCERSEKERNSGWNCVSRRRKRRSWSCADALKR
jgi:hypothetical protein